MVLCLRNALHHRCRYSLTPALVYQGARDSQSGCDRLFVATFKNFRADSNPDIDITASSFVSYVESEGVVHESADISNQLLFIAMLICGRMCLAQGAGVHQWNLPLHNYIGVVYVLSLVCHSSWPLTDYEKWLYVVQIVYAPTIFLIKTSILLQYLNLFAPEKVLDPFMWYSARTIIVVSGIYYTISTFLTIFACSPREAIWNPLITNPKCINRNAGVPPICLYNITSDIIILILAARAVWNLRLPYRTKLRIVLLFALGLL